MATNQMNNIFSQIQTFASESGVLLVGAIPPLEALEAAANADDKLAIAQFSAPSRRAERLAWRIMLRMWAQCHTAWEGKALEVNYTSQGAPEIKNFPYKYIAVSHCRDRVAVALAQKPCSVDIERCDRNFHAIASRYLAAEELALAESEPTLGYAAIWCAKECLYKLQGTSGMELKHDIRIEKVDFAQGTISGRVLQHRSISLQCSVLDQEYIVVYHI